MHAKQFKHLLATIPDDAQVLVCGAELRCVYHDSDGNAVSMDSEPPDSFMDSADKRRCTVLYDGIESPDRRLRPFMTDEV